MSFENDISSFLIGLKKKQGKYLGQTVNAAYGGIMRGTRVDTGTARANWNVNLGSIDYELNNRNLTSGKKSELEGQNPTGREERESGEVRTQKQLENGKFGDVYISNSLPYIQGLEDKDHMVRNTVRDVKKAIESGALND